MKRHGFVLQQIDSVLTFQKDSPKKYLLKEMWTISLLGCPLVTMETADLLRT